MEKILKEIKGKNLFELASSGREVLYSTGYYKNFKELFNCSSLKHLLVTTAAKYCTRYSGDVFYDLSHLQKLAEEELLVGVNDVTTCAIVFGDSGTYFYKEGEFSCEDHLVGKAYLMVFSIKTFGNRSLNVYGYDLREPSIKDNKKPLCNKKLICNEISDAFNTTPPSFNTAALRHEMVVAAAKYCKGFYSSTVFEAFAEFQSQLNSLNSDSFGFAGDIVFEPYGVHYYPEGQFLSDSSSSYQIVVTVSKDSAEACGFYYTLKARGYEHGGDDLCVQG